MNILQATPSNIGGESWGYFLLFKRMILIKFDNNKQNTIIIIVYYLIDPLFQYNWRQPSFYKATNILYHIFFSLLFLSDWFVNQVKGLHWSKESCLLSTQKLAVEWHETEVVRRSRSPLNYYASLNLHRLPLSKLFLWL